MTRSSAVPTGTDAGPDVGTVGKTPDDGPCPLGLEPEPDTFRLVNAQNWSSSLPWSTVTWPLARSTTNSPAAVLAPRPSSGSHAGS